MTSTLPISRVVCSALLAAPVVEQRFDASGSTFPEAIGVLDLPRGEGVGPNPSDLALEGRDDQQGQDQQHAEPGRDPHARILVLSQLEVIVRLRRLPGQWRDPGHRQRPHSSPTLPSYHAASPG